MIVTPEELRAYRRQQAGKIIVHAHGCFDLSHVGHVRHLKAAKALGDLLVVTVTPDHLVNKGPERPAFPADLRIEVLREFRCVDAVFINAWPSAVEAIGYLRSNIFVKGSEYRDKMTDGLRAEKAAVEEMGGQLVFTDEIEFHSTDLIRKVLRYG